MNEEVNFFKIHGSGNDFIVVDSPGLRELLDDRQVEKICDRHFGVGADGIIFCERSEVADLKVTFINPDGTEAEMCGNGIRCAALYMLIKQYDTSENKSMPENNDTPVKLSIETLAGIKTLSISSFDLKSADVAVNMGKPEFKAANIPSTYSGSELIDSEIEADGHKLIVSAASMGNPHLIVDLGLPQNNAIFGSEISDADLTKFGPLLENHQIFPKRTNVEFINILNSEEIKIRVWERGTGETLACGTGACATFAICERRGKVGKSVTVYLPGGPLKIKYSDGDVIMEGPAELVYSGLIII